MCEPHPSDEMSARGSIGAHIQWSQCEDRTARTANARKAANDRFLDQVDPQRTLPPQERAKRAENARRAHMKRMARRSVQVRKRKKAQRLRDEAARVEAESDDLDGAT